MRVEGGGLDGDRSCVGVGGTQAGTERRETGPVTEGDRIYIESKMGASGGLHVNVGGEMDGCTYIEPLFVNKK